ncbi:flagellar basal body rod protein FlgC [Pueribacillus theae]|uniref:Flagellar basal-body rod protein FlgC n=1 Tax=Pueribacillus theae TaxID=2171751 RepID=A0A2U1K8A4_9BACI|nr:flagellar basal body rod protein FlgC [Pueribacillus theae]PWA13499.1 flagellar basal body rod protein FlgC [Pueribacillus theae]
MSIFHSMNTSASGLTVQRLRMDIASSNIANADTTRGRFVNGEWLPYRRKMVALKTNESQFTHFLRQAIHNKNSTIGNGVKAAGIVDDQTPFKTLYQPEHPDADENGYVRLPNVDPLKEMVDIMSASRSYEANITALNASKGMLVKALEIGK